MSFGNTPAHPTRIIKPRRRRSQRYGLTHCRMLTLRRSNGPKILWIDRDTLQDMATKDEAGGCASRELWIRLWRRAGNFVKRLASYAQENYKIGEFRVAPRRLLGNPLLARESAGMSAMREPPAKAERRERLRSGAAFGWSGHGSRRDAPGDRGTSSGGRRFGEADGSTSVDAGRAGGSPPVAGSSRRSGRRLPGTSALSLPVVSAFLPAREGGTGRTRGTFGRLGRPGASGPYGLRSVFFGTRSGDPEGTRRPSGSPRSGRQLCPPTLGSTRRGRQSA